MTHKAKNIYSLASYKRKFANPSRSWTILSKTEIKDILGWPSVRTSSCLGLFTVSVALEDSSLLGVPPHSVLF
jgi:hypothetical protein